MMNNTLTTKELLVLLNKKNFECFSVIVDKVNLHQAFELDTDLIALSKMKNFPKQNDIYFK